MTMHSQNKTSFSITTCGHRGYTAEEGWAELGRRQAARYKEALRIGSLKAITQARTLYFYPVTKTLSKTSTQARMHFLAGLLGASVKGAGPNDRLRLENLMLMAEEAGYKIKIVDFNSHIPA